MHLCFIFNRRKRGKYSTSLRPTEGDTLQSNWGLEQQYRRTEVGWMNRWINGGGGRTLQCGRRPLGEDLTKQLDLQKPHCIFALMHLADAGMHVAWNQNKQPWRCWATRVFTWPENNDKHRQTNQNSKYFPTDRKSVSWPLKIPLDFALMHVADAWMYIIWDQTHNLDQQEHSQKQKIRKTDVFLVFLYR